MAIIYHLDKVDLAWGGITGMNAAILRKLDKLEFLQKLNEFSSEKNIY